MAKEKKDSILDNLGTGLNRYLKTGSFGEIGIETGTAIKVGLALFLGITLAGIAVVIYYKKAIKK